MASKIFAGRLPYSMTDEQLAELFAPHGTVEKATIIFDRSTGQSKGFGFVEMASDEDANAAIEVYRRFKVPEVWVCDEYALRILVLRPNGRYVESSASASFPFLTAADVFEWVRKPQTEPDTTWIKQLRTWVKRTLKPRARREARSGGQERNPTT